MNEEERKKLKELLFEIIEGAKASSSATATDEAIRAAGLLVSMDANRP